MAAERLEGFLHQLRGALRAEGDAGAAEGRLLERFLADRDEAAFAALLRRHGPMVLGVCRRILGNAHDAEDAFQATFLILVSKGATVRPRGMVGNWLYDVAYRTALGARRAADRRRVKEARVMPRCEPAGAWDELREVLDQELVRLADKYRSPLVLCDLEGKTRKEAARQLGWPGGTVASRLATARRLLAKRLGRHGLPLSGAALTAALAPGAASAAVPAALQVLTSEAASLLVVEGGAAPGLPAAVTALMKGGICRCCCRS
jgi:RNA polymerase sigma factor (sigma-70 family)